MHSICCVKPSRSAKARLRWLFLHLLYLSAFSYSKRVFRGALNAFDYLLCLLATLKKAYPIIFRYADLFLWLFCLCFFFRRSIFLFNEYYCHCRSSQKNYCCENTAFNSEISACKQLYIRRRSCSENSFK